MADDEEGFDWDADDFDPDAFDPDAGFASKDKDDKQWEGEDEGIEREIEKAKQVDVTATPTGQSKKSKQERIEDIKAKRRAQDLAVQQQEASPTPEEALAEKLRIQKLQKDADLAVAKELFGMGEGKGGKSLDQMVPEDAQEFDEFLQLLKTKLLLLAGSPHYFGFMDNLLRSCCAGLDAEDLRKLSGTLSLMATEKTKASKAKSKKKGGKVTIATGKASKKTDLSAFGDYDEDDEYIDDSNYDFM